MRRICALLLVACGGPAATRAPALLGSGLDEPGPWTSFATDGASARVEGTAGGALRLSLDFAGTAGYALARRPLPLELPENFEISFDVRGELPENQLELKLVDASGLNVWWHRRAAFAPPREWRREVVKRRHIEFAWGPTEDRALRRMASLELVVATGKGGGKGWIEIDNLSVRALPPSGPAPPPAIAWRGATTLSVDLGVERDLGGLIVTWGEPPPRDYVVERSLDGRSWTAVAEVRGGDGGEDAFRLDELAARWLRLRLAAPATLVDLRVVGVEEARTATDLVQLLAARAPRGAYPRGLSGEQPYWTIVGVDGGEATALLSEDGAVELAPGGFSVEPSVVVGGRTFTWADVAITQSLLDGYLPLPSVTWRGDGWELTVRLFGRGEPRDAQLVARYDLRNTGGAPLAARLSLAARPFQVNGPKQFLNIAGGVSPIRELAWREGRLWVNGAAALQPLAPPSAVKLAPLQGAADARDAVSDPSGLASATLDHELRVAPGESATAGFIASLAGPLRAPPADLGAALQGERARWHEKLDRVTLRVPEAGRAVVDTLRSSLAYMLLSRAGVNLRPGTRSYARSWIRDGAMISEALLRLGHGRLAVDYLRWFAPYQFANGKVPCCVDPGGAVPVPEHDSHGQLIYLAAMVYRYTQDRALLAELWPRVQAAIRYMDGLRASEASGLLPPSISHEGYSAKPAYSYWDDFWGLRGYKDAVTIAEVLGDRDAATRIAAARDDFRRDILDSIQASVARHGIDFIPGAADLGDFDATSTTIALSPVGEQHHLPPALLHATFERYWNEFVSRRERRKQELNYTPYELRVVGSFVRLGWRDRAHQALAFFFDDRRPAAWNQWAEVVGEPERTPIFIGDMPHAWVHSDYARSALDLFAYERDRDAALVLAAGVPAAWLDGDGVAIAGLATPHGALGYRLRAAGGTLRLDVDAGAVPPGGLVLAWPYDLAARRPGATRVNGRPAAWRGDAPELLITARPARVEIQWRSVP